LPSASSSSRCFSASPGNSRPQSRLTAKLSGVALPRRGFTEGRQSSSAATTVEELKARLEKQMVDEVWDPAMDAVVASPKEHAVIFENENIRVLRVAVDGGSGEPNHHHRWPSVFVFDELPGCPIADYNAAGDKIGEFDLGDAPKVLIFPPQPTHRVENTGSKPIRGIRVEFKNGQLKY
jgi:hypothetical protein